MKFDNILNHIQRCGIVLPMTRTEALKIRGIGPKSIPFLQEHGIVKGDLETRELSTRAYNCLDSFGITSRKEAKQAILSGRIKIEKIRNCGCKTTCEIYKWVGLKPPFLVKYWTEPITNLTIPPQ